MAVGYNSMKYIGSATDSNMKKILSVVVSTSMGVRHLSEILRYLIQVSGFKNIMYFVTKILGTTALTVCKGFGCGLRWH